MSLEGLRPLPRTLLMLLALHHARKVHREHLIDALWPGVPVDAAAHRLHAAASTVRRHFVAEGLGEVLHHHGGAYLFELPHCEQDVEAFDRAAHRAARCRARGEDEEALRCGLSALDWYAGDLLPEAGPQEWVVAERARLRTEAARTAYLSARLATARRPLEETLELVHRAAELDPLRDSAWVLLAEVQTRMGDLTAAAATRRRHALVSAETGVVVRRPLTRR